MDILFINKLNINTHIGVSDLERKNKQKIIIDIELESDNYKAAESLKIEKCLDYKNISNTIIQYVEKNKFILVEEVAEKIASILLKKFPISWVRIKVTKPKAIQNTKKVGVIIERRI